MAKMYTLDKKLLVGTPEIRIGDKCYTVDDREKTARKVIAICNREDGNDFDKVDEVLKCVLTSKDFKEIDGMNLPYAAYQELFNLIISAVMGEDPDKSGSADGEERFQTAEE